MSSQHVLLERPIKIYVAGPLSDGAVGYIKNMHRMLREALKIHKIGASPYIPCLDVLMGMFTGDWDYNDYFSMSEAWLRVADAVYAYDGSPGVFKEIMLAEKLGIPVFRFFKDLTVWYRAKMEEMLKKDNYGIYNSSVKEKLECLDEAIENVLKSEGV